jgi:hypothetical protein
LLQQLPAAHLTKFCADVDFSSSASLQAIAGLTGLQHLELCNAAVAAAPTAAAIIPDDVLAPLAAGLQQLTQLHLKPVHPAQVQWLPRKLQQLHVTVEVCNEPQQLLQLAAWLQQHANKVRRLELQGGPSSRDAPGWDAAVEALTKAFQPAVEAGPAPPPAAAADADAGVQDATVAAVTHAPSLQLQALLCRRVAAPVPEHLPVSALTELECQINWGRTAQVGTLCSLTSLQKLGIQSAEGYTSWQPDSVLHPLSALQRLTSLKLDWLKRQQLQHLQMPQLLELIVNMEPQEQENAVQLQVGHLTRLCKLRLSDYAASLQPVDQFPPNVQELELTVVAHSIADATAAASDKGCGLQSLLQLSQLQKLQLQLHGLQEACGLPEAYQIAMRQLSSLTSLPELHLTCKWPTVEAMRVDVAAVPGCLSGLPLKSISWTSRDMAPAVLQSLRHLQGLTSLEVDTLSQNVGFHSETTPGGVAAILRPLTELRRLHLRMYSRKYAASVGSPLWEACTSSGSHTIEWERSSLHQDDVQGVAALLRCVGGLSKVEEVRVVFLVRLHELDVQQLQAMLQQLLPSYMLPFCKVEARKISIQL